MILTDEQKEFLKENFPNDYDEMEKSEDTDDILLPLDALITDKGFDKDYALNDFGDIAQRLYDEIYDQNKFL